MKTPSAVLPLMMAMFFVGAAMSGASSPSISDDIAKVRSQWADDLRNKRLEEITALYAPDAAFLSGDVGRVTGRSAIHDLCKKVMAAVDSHIVMHSVRTEHSGDLAFDSGDFEETLTKLSDGTSQNAKGSYLMVLKSQPDGRWLIVEQMWIDSTPPSH
jgi:ketosteroid isomerase-like protein